MLRNTVWFYRRGVNKTELDLRGIMLVSVMEDKCEGHTDRNRENILKNFSEALASYI